MRVKRFPFWMPIVLFLAIFGFNPTIGMAQGPTATPVPAAIVDVKDSWDLAAIYPDDAAWERDLQLVKNTYIPEFKKYEGKLGDAAALARLLELGDKANRTMDKVYVYAAMRRDENNADSAASEKAGRAASLTSELNAAMSFVRPELLALDRQVLEGYLRDARFKDYDVYLRGLVDTQAHTLSPAEEKLLAMAGELYAAPDTIATKIREADLAFPTIKDPSGVQVQVTEGTYRTLLQSPDRAFRALVYQKMFGTYGSMENSLAAALDAQMRADSYFARARKYESSLDAALGSSHVPPEIYTRLISTTNSSLSTLHRYVSLRKKVLGIDQVRAYDFFVPLAPSQNIRISYPEAQTILALALKPLGDQYVADLNKAFASRWVDAFEKPHKTSGAYAWGSYDTHPYVLLSYDGTVSNLLTLGHEMGHAMNFYYTYRAQPYAKSSSPTFTGEVASTTNEMLILRYLIQNAKSDDEKLAYLSQLAETLRSTFFAQVMYAEFEQQIHERVEQGNALSADSLNDMWGKILAKYYGQDYEATEEAKLGWSAVPHFYMDYYVYQYATSISAADQLSADLAAGKAGAVDKYLAFLKAGTSDYPAPLLKNAGADMLSGQPINTLIADFYKTLDEMEKLLVKMGKIKP